MKLRKQSSISRQNNGSLYELLCIPFCVLLLLAGCADPPDRPLRIGTKSWLGYEPLFLARERGMLDEQTVHLVEYPSASEVIRALRNKAIDGAALTVDEVLLLSADGLQPRIVLVMDISNGGDAILGQPGTESLSQLEGLRVGVESGAMGAYVLSRALEQNGMTSSDVAISSLDAHEHEAAFHDKEVDAVVTFEPVLSRLLESGAVTLFDSTQIPGEIVDVLVVWEEVTTQRQQAIRHLLGGWFAALDQLQTDPDAASQSIAGRLQISAPQVLDALERMRFPSLDENRRLVGGQPPELSQPTRRLMQVMRSHRLLPSEVDTEALFDARSLEALR